jgi:hypothetical protein
MFSYLLASMSLTSHAIPYLYVIFSIVIILNYNFRRDQLDYEKRKGFSINPHT